MDNSIAIRTTQAPDLVTVRRDSKTYPRLAQISREQAVSQLYPCVLQAYMYRGQNPDSDLVNFTTGNLVDELMADAEGVGLRGLTVYEITRAVKKAVLGQSGKELYGVNVASLYSVCVDYATGEGHMADKAAKKQQEQSKPVQALLDTMTGAMISNIKARSDE